MVTTAVMLLVYAIVKASDYGWGSARTIGVGLGALVLLGGIRLARVPASRTRSFRCGCSARAT